MNIFKAISALDTVAYDTQLFTPFTLSALMLKLLKQN